mmetsp:Transcript_21645/g.69782  ORF Transcript_21645/g.69782 Transcript_21645/m.69782 type:complete len:349 (-) Transcript_21645:187-1233(-)
MRRDADALRAGRRPALLPGPAVRAAADAALALWRHGGKHGHDGAVCGDGVGGQRADRRQDRLRLRGGIALAHPDHPSRHAQDDVAGRRCCRLQAARRQGQARGARRPLPGRPRQRGGLLRRLVPLVLRLQPGDALAARRAGRRPALQAGPLGGRRRHRLLRVGRFLQLHPRAQDDAPDVSRDHHVQGGDRPDHRQGRRHRPLHPRPRYPHPHQRAAGVHVHGRLEVPRGAHGLSGRARRCGGRTKAEGGGGRRRPAGGGPLAAGGWRPALHSPPLPPSLCATTRRWSVSLDGIVCLARFLFDGAAVRAKSLTLYCRVSMCAREGWYMCNVAGHLAGRAACTRCGGCGR